MLLEVVGNGLKTNFFPTTEEIKNHQKDENLVFHSKLNGNVVVNDPLAHQGMPELVSVDMYRDWYALCTSMQLDPNLCKKWGSHIVSFDSNEMMRYITQYCCNAAWLGKGNVNCAHSHIIYTDDEIVRSRVGNKDQILHKFIKRTRSGDKYFKDEYEYRFLINIGTDIAQQDYIDIGCHRKMDSAEIVIL